MKRCATCRESKDEIEFNKNQDRCRACCKLWYFENKDSHKANVKKQRKVNQQRARDFVYQFLLDHPCVDCGESDPIVLQFDHVRGTKRTDVSKMVNMGYGVDTIQTEIDKCEIRCANCHARRTALVFGWWVTKMGV